ncbi:hypothetical protein [Paraburkholderia sp. DHOC27]|uniref:hypothetical protein n=1 Tax=Paraburkholderia sp. DHOC27 TaxID=2303330 RepID=UPI000E3B6AAA|nr:hypothetical protein [Paraburkholderia sp. DHOC27]RFU48210.1 hypothetical protein D0B32_08955 [Paraburkholderia sp. DHOC27]
MLTSWFWSGETLRSRSVSDIVLSATLDIPMPPASVLTDWQRETSTHMMLEVGDVEAMPLARTLMRWKDYASCVRAAADWTRSLALPGMLDSAEVALMACRGARYHHDAGQYGGAAFCNLFLSEDKGLDVHFPALDLRIPLTRGTALIFDTAQPHAVIQRHSTRFDAAQFAPQADLTQIFLTWELPIESAMLSGALGVRFDVAAPSSPTHPDDEQVWLNGEPVTLCPESGRWLRADRSSSG